MFGVNILWFDVNFINPSLELARLLKINQTDGLLLQYRISRQLTCGANLRVELQNLYLVYGDSLTTASKWVALVVGRIVHIVYTCKVIWSYKSSSFFKCTSTDSVHGKSLIVVQKRNSEKEWGVAYHRARPLQENF